MLCIVLIVAVLSGCCMCCVNVTTAIINVLFYPVYNFPHLNYFVYTTFPSNKIASKSSSLQIAVDQRNDWLRKNPRFPLVICDNIEWC